MMGLYIGLRTFCCGTSSEEIRVAVRYIAIEGITGVGKTQLAHLLAGRLHAHLALEDVTENPFLPLFYEDPQHYGFQTQVFFMLSRYRQQQELHQMDLFQTVVISNFIFERDRIYANVGLNDAEFALYDRLAETLSEKIPRPDLVVYLQDSIPHLLGRIRARDRGYERVISEEYLARLSEAYNHFFFHYTDSPLLVVNVSEIDFANQLDDLDDLVQQILSPPAGTRYYRPVHVDV
ncbi:MAG: deoxyguanosine kinase [Candidatus Latescibacterota bacterium]|jgi:deoxyguanosine kinase